MWPFKTWTVFSSSELCNFKNTTSMSQHLKRCGRFVTGDTTPKRPCLTTSQSPVATSINSDHLCSHDRLSKHCQKEHETAASDDYSSAPCRLDQVSAAFDAGSTPQNDTPWKFGTAPSVVQLRHRRTELRNSIAAKQQALHNLDLVKLHRAKSDVELLKSLTSKWCSVVQKATVELYELIPEPRPSLTEFIDHLQLDHGLIGFNDDDESFD